MKVLELCETCSNNGTGKIEIININNLKDRTVFNDINELKKTSIKNFKVSTWEFIPHARINSVEWEFTLAIIVE